MRNQIILLLIAFTLVSCKTIKKDYHQNIDTITFYDFNENKISLESIKDQWNQRLQEKEKINAGIQKLQVVYLTDQTTKQEKLVLLATTSQKATKTASELSPFKDGLQLSNKTITCKNCGGNLNIEISNGNWICSGKDEGPLPCTKIVTITSGETTMTK